jgi:hypothetical protein
MYRLVAIFLMLVVPLQFAWSTALSVHGHIGTDAAVFGFHSHDGSHDHGHGDGDPQTPPDAAAAGLGNNGDSGDGHSGGHYHPIFVSLTIDSDLKLDDALVGAPPACTAVILNSRTPSLFDWPPSARC